MTTDTDITNRALQLIGTRTTITSLAEQSNEAFQANLVYNAIRDWCFGMANWNFARSVVVLAQTKAAAPAGAWTTAQPPPPWLYQYATPAGFIRAQYFTNNELGTDPVRWLGEPKRFAIGNDSNAQVLLCNESAATLIYTGRITDPTNWPWYYERLMVGCLASTLCNALTGSDSLEKNLQEKSNMFFVIAEQSNREEGLSFGDTTPEWIQASGIPYPYRRQDTRTPPQAPGGKSDNNR